MWCLSFTERFFLRRLNFSNFCSDIFSGIFSLMRSIIIFSISTSWSSAMNSDALESELTSTSSILSRMRIYLFWSSIICYLDLLSLACSFLRRACLRDFSTAFYASSKNPFSSISVEPCSFILFSRDSFNSRYFYSSFFLLICAAKSSFLSSSFSSSLLKKVLLRPRRTWSFNFSTLWIETLGLRMTSLSPMTWLALGPCIGICSCFRTIRVSCSFSNRSSLLKSFTTVPKFASCSWLGGHKRCCYLNF